MVDPKNPTWQIQPQTSDDLGESLQKQLAVAIRDKDLLAGVTAAVQMINGAGKTPNEAVVP